MSRFAKLAVSTLVATFVLIGLGGFVRAMEAGLGCPDWPTCHGSLNPPSSLSAGPLRLAWIEHSHRLWAAVLIVLICVLAYVARRTRQPRPVRWACYALVPAVLSQAVLGAIVVWLKLDAESVTLHLAGALSIVALATYVVVRTGDLAVVDSGPRLRLLSRAVAVATFAQMLVGATVTGYGAGLALPGFPSFASQPGVGTRAVALQVTHRLLAFLIVGLAAALVVHARRTGDDLAGRLATALAFLVAVQVALGVTNVVADLTAWSVVPHLAVGSWIWALAVVLVLRAGESGRVVLEPGTPWRVLGPGTAS